MSHGQKSRFFGDGCFPTFNDGNPYFMGPYKTPTDLGWISHPLLYGNVMGVDRPVVSVNPSSKALRLHRRFSKKIRRKYISEVGGWTSQANMEKYERSKLEIFPPFLGWKYNKNEKPPGSYVDRFHFQQSVKCTLSETNIALENRSPE